MQPLLIVANLNQAALSCTVPSAPTSPANRFFFYSIFSWSGPPGLGLVHN